MPSTHHFQVTVEPKLPRSHGMCRHCLRDMWDGVKIPRGKTRVSGDRRVCVACIRYVEQGIDPTTVHAVAAEVLPAERSESDTSWRASPYVRCRDLPTSFFSPELDPDDPEYVAMTKDQRGELWAERRRIAATLCNHCPLAVQCRKTAIAHGYEGLWGRAWFHRTRWEDLLTGARGLTMHADRRARRNWAEAA